MSTATLAAATKGRIGSYICIDEHGNIINNQIITATLPGSESEVESNSQQRSVTRNGFSVTAMVYGELTDDEIIEMVKRNIGASQRAFADRDRQRRIVPEPGTYEALDG